MNSFLQRHVAQVLGMVKGWDRLRLRGTIRSISHAAGLSQFLSYSGRLLKDFKEYALASSRQVKEAAMEVGERAGRPAEYLGNPGVSKEEVALDIARRDGIKQGLICTLSAVEPCWSFDLWKNPANGHVELRQAYRKCLHIYQYYQHPVFGFMHVRLQTWLPFTQHVCLNGREWLGRQMDKRGLGYMRRDNCFVWLQDVAAAQRLLDAQARFDWQPALAVLGRRVCPVIPQVLKPYDVEYYWSIDESEWATDVMFRSEAELAALYPNLIRHAMESFGSRDVMRFLGQRVPLVGPSHPHDYREVVTDLKGRPEGIRVKHRLAHNSVKMYNKQGSVLRVETTLNNVRELKTPRKVKGKVVWKPMRKGVADARGRAEVSDAANERYLEAIASIDTPVTLQKLTETLSRPKSWNGQKVRGLNLLGEQDAKLLEVVGRGEFLLHGLRNRDLQAAFFPTATDDPREKRRRSGQMSRKLRMLRAHGLLQKLPHTHRYQVSPRGRQVITALIAARQADIAKLTKAA
jgi:hypothetical protein